MPDDMVVLDQVISSSGWPILCLYPEKHDVPFIQAHQRYEVYRQAMVSGATHLQSLRAALRCPDEVLPEVCFEVVRK